jgi:elongation factor 1-delta
LEARLEKLEIESQQMANVIKNLENIVVSLETKLNAVLATVPDTKEVKKPEPAAEKNGNGVADEDDIDLFGSDEEEDDQEKERLKEEILKAYQEKKSKKPGPIAKSNVILDVKPWDDETDMKEMERRVREIQTDGLLWGAARLVPLAYGINKLQISSVVEDEKVSIDWLQETIQEIEELVQSVDIAAFNKI